MCIRDRVRNRNRYMSLVARGSLSASSAVRISGGSHTLRGNPSRQRSSPEQQLTPKMCIRDRAGDRGVVVVTTPKDAVKLPAPPPGLDVFVVHPRLQVCSGQACVDEMLQRIQSAIVDRNRPSG